MAFCGSGQSQNHLVLSLRDQRTDRTSPPGPAAKETGSAGSDQCGEFLLRETDAGQDRHGLRAARWRNTSRNHRMVRPVLPEGESDRGAQPVALQAVYQVYV